jgi:hypothetical protein
MLEDKSNLTAHVIVTMLLFIFREKTSNKHEKYTKITTYFNRIFEQKYSGNLLNLDKICFGEKKLQ